MNRVPDYEERSKLVADLCANDVALQKAREEIYGSLTESVTYLKDVVKNPTEKTENRLKAAIEHCKLAGLYTEKIDLSGKLEGIKIFLPEQDGGAHGA